MLWNESNISWKAEQFFCRAVVSSSWSCTVWQENSHHQFAAKQNMQNRNHFHRAFKDKRTSWSRLFSMQPNYRWKLCSCEEEAKRCLKRGERLWSLKTRMFAAIFTLAHTKDRNVVDAVLWITRSVVTLANVAQCGTLFCKFCKILRHFFAKFEQFATFWKFCALWQPFANYTQFSNFGKSCTMWNFVLQILQNTAFFCQIWAICHLL